MCHLLQFTDCCPQALSRARSIDKSAAVCCSPTFATWCSYRLCLEPIRIPVHPVALAPEPLVVGRASSLPRPLARFLLPVVEVVDVVVVDALATTVLDLDRDRR